MVRPESHDIARELRDLERGLEILKIPFNARIIEQFREYIELLYAYEGKIHLISRGDYEYISRRHVLPSLVALQHISHCRTVCDVGAGAGFPSVPLKLFTPGIHYTLFESKRKTARFLNELAGKLQLRHVEIIAERAEQCTDRRFDLILLKAVGAIQKMLGTIDQLLVPQGRAIFFKSPEQEREIAEAQVELTRLRLGVRVELVSTPLENSPLALVIVERQY
jgi:16S rRNA (guanine527-N7)-methyltransferase